MIEYHVYEFEELLGGVCFYPRGGFHRRGYIVRRRIDMEIDAVSFSEEVSQQGVLKPQYLLSQWETTEKFMGAEFLEQKHYSMYRRFMEYRSKRFMASQSAQARCLGQDVAFCVWCIYDAYFARLQELVQL
jgi:hypothetical protein